MAAQAIRRLHRGVLAAHQRVCAEWVLARADAARWTYAGQAEAFFDDTQIEVFGPSFEGARINYEGHLALSWQTLWFGPFLVDGQLGSPGEVSSALPQMLQQHRELWQKRSCDFLADSGSSSTGQLKAIDRAGFTHWSVSYNQWTSVPERPAVALPPSAWSPPRPRAVGATGWKSPNNTPASGTPWRKVISR
jgi:hypothetical protein